MCKLRRIIIWTMPLMTAILLCVFCLCSFADQAQMPKEGETAAIESTEALPPETGEETVLYLAAGAVCLTLSGIIGMSAAKRREFRREA